MFTKFSGIVLFVLVGSALSTPWIPESRDAYWVRRHESLVNQTHQHAQDVKAVFLGDSITEGWAGNGKQVWQQHYQPRHAYNYGIGGDRTEHVLWRLEHGEFEKVSPKVVVLMIGTLYSSSVTHFNLPFDPARNQQHFPQGQSCRHCQGRGGHHQGH